MLFSSANSKLAAGYLDKLINLTESSVNKKLTSDLINISESVKFVKIHSQHTAPTQGGYKK